MLKLLKQFNSDQSGAAMVEYSILIGLITAAAVGAIVIVGGYVATSWTALTNIIAP